MTPTDTPGLKSSVAEAGLSIPPPPSSAPTARKPIVSMPATSSKAAAQLPAQERKWNTDRLSLRLVSDGLAALSAGSLVAPVISIIDRSIMENASGRASLSESLKSSFKTLFTRPHSIIFSKPSLLILMLYGGTYLTANTLDTTFSTLGNKPASSVTAGGPKFAASSAANVGLCIYKDQVFVKLFGPPGRAPASVGAASYALFAARDCLTIFASFNVPPLVAPYFNDKLGPELRKHVSGATTAQFVAPATVQLFSTPLHLLGLDLYNRPRGAAGPSFAERWKLIRKAWLPSAAARICRIVPAFGVGGVVNTKVRKSLQSKLE